MSAAPLVLVDGSSYLYRAFHALPPLSTATGQPTGAVYGVVTMLYKLIDEYGPERMAVIFDAPGRTFRDDLYAEYKANRVAMPDELRAQVEPLRDAIEAMGIPLLRINGVEADDVIGTLAKAASASATPTIISTIDKDLAQLVSDHVTLVNTMDNTKLDRQGVQQKFGVTPEQMIDYLALVGDSSDNIPGVDGVGAKTAAKWLQKYGDLATLKAQSAEISGKVGERLRESFASVDLSRELATIRCDLSLPVTLNELTLREPDAGRLRELFTRLEFKRLLARLEAVPSGSSPEGAPQVVPAASPAQVRYETVLTDRDLARWIERLGKTRVASLEVKATTLKYMRAELVGIALAVAPGEAAYIPVEHRHPGAPAQLARDVVLERLAPWLSSSAPKAGHDLKYAAHVFRSCGIALSGRRFDAMLESYVLNSTAIRHDAAAAAAAYLGAQRLKHDDVVGKGAKEITFDQVAIDLATRYAAEGADYALRLHEALWPQLGEIPQLKSLYEEIEEPLIGVLERMERCGVMVNAAMLKQQSQELAAAMALTERAAYDAAGGPFNLGSPKQLQEVLYDRLHLPVLGKTPKGQPSTAENVLQELAESYPLPKLVLDYRALAKLKSTYTDKLPAEIDPRTGRIHTSYHQAVAATGRLSSSDPNLQNIPIRTQEGRRIRQAFVAAPGFVLLAADYSQIELRIMAHLSGDEGLLAAFASGADIHRATAAEVFGTPLAAVDDEQRRSAKAINFGLIYGMSAFGLARQLGLERAQAQQYVDLYFQRYPGVRRYMDETRRRARELGFVTTVFGRRLYLPDINARNVQQRQYAERSAINAPMQGTAADIIKRAMIDVDRWIDAERPSARLIMQVHDELIVEVAERDADRVRSAVVSIMENAGGPLTVPLRVDSGLGQNWDEAH
jgi:DNA polymerase-1